MKYRVYQDGRPCSSYNLHGWTKDTFDTLEEASVFAWYWVLPISKEQAKAFNTNYPFTVGSPRATWGDSVVMEIKEVL